MIDITVDGHVHTRLCHHASGEMEDYVRAAVSRGLNKIYFLEHLERGISSFEATWLSEQDFSYYLIEGQRLKAKYHGRIAIGMGVEVGYNPDSLPEILAFLGRYPWDRIGISYHFLKTASPLHLNMLSRKQEHLDEADRHGVDQVVTDYYAGLLAAIAALPGTVLCHPDAVLRHHPEISSPSRHRPLLLAILDAAAGKSMAIEVNTSGYRHRNYPYPAAFIIKEAVKRGLKFTAGSDAHRPEDVGHNFELLPDFIAQALECPE